MFDSKNPKLTIIIIIIFVVVGIFSFYHFLDDENRLYSSYPRISKKIHVENKIKSFKNEHGSLLIDFYDNAKYSIFVNNITSYAYDFFEFVQENDSLIKKENSDTIIIKRDGKEYIFEMTEKNMDLSKYKDW